MSNHWNYRILAKKVDNDVQYGIYEVHYTDGIPHSCTVNEIAPLSFGSDHDIEDPIESIKWQLDSMRIACDKPVLDYDNFPNKYLKYYRHKKLNSIKKILNEE